MPAKYPVPRVSRKPPGCLYAKSGRLWWRGKLPGETKISSRGVKPLGAKFALTDTPGNRIVASEVLWKWHREALARTEGTPLDVVSVEQVVVAYLNHSDTYYRDPSGRPTGERDTIEYACRYLLELFRNDPADTLDQTCRIDGRTYPSKLEAVQAAMTEKTKPDGRKQLSRNTINKYVNITRRMLRWAAQKKFVPASVYHAALLIDPLKKGRSTARETISVTPPDPVSVEETKRFLPPVLCDMIELQRRTGMRSSELCTIRTSEIDRSGEIWVYSPLQHKTQWRGQGRHVAIGPAGQAILEPYLATAGKKYIFRPEEAMTQREKGSGRTNAPRYTKDTYRRAVQYAFDAARKENAALPPELRKTLTHWTPHQLRHEFITNVKRSLGAEIARAAGGHSSLDATEIYIEKDLQAAIEAAKKLG